MAHETTTYTSFRHAPYGLEQANYSRAVLYFRNGAADFEVDPGDGRKSGITAVEYRVDPDSDDEYVELWLDYSALGGAPTIDWAPTRLTPYANEGGKLKYRFQLAIIPAEPHALVWWIERGAPPYTLAIKLSKKIAA